jgi:hypothetical protein
MSFRQYSFLLLRILCVTNFLTLLFASHDVVAKERSLRGRERLFQVVSKMNESISRVPVQRAGIEPGTSYVALY